MAITFTFSPHGESILVETNQFNMLIDGGNSDPVRHFKRIKGYMPNVDAVVVTHIDRDHIGGVISLLSNPDHSELVEGIKYIVFNEPTQSALFREKCGSKKTSKAQGAKLKHVIDVKKINHVSHVCVEKYMNNPLMLGNSDELVIEVISPYYQALNKLYDDWDFEKYKVQKKNSTGIIADKSLDELAEGRWIDSSIPNGSSIAFLLKYKCYRFLLLADAHIEQITQALKDKFGATKENPLKIDFVKLSHHGSKSNVNREFLEIIDTDSFIICKPSSSNKTFPHKETIAKIVKINRERNPNGVNFLINGSVGKRLRFTRHEEDSNKFSFVESTNLKLTFE